MSRIYTSSDQLIGHTPLLELSKIEKEYGLKARILAKLEYLNPSGSVKDRIAKAMIDDAEAEGKITPETVIIEPTSGNTGIALAMLGAQLKLRVIIVMPESMSVERRRMIQAYGAELVLSDASAGMQGAIDKMKELMSGHEEYVTLGQFDNPDNVLAHYETSGPEILKQQPDVDIFVAGVGTGGTFSGISRRLKEHDPHILCVAVEPASSALLSGRKAGAHKIQGIGANFIPGNFDAQVCDDIATVSDEEAMREMVSFGRETGILVGIGELFFRANGLYNGLAMFHKMVTQFSLACIRSGSLFQIGMRKKDFLLVAVFLVVLVLVGIAQERGVRLGTRLRQSPVALRVAVYYAVLLALIIFGAYGAGYVPVDPIYAGF